jgi:hypothetical protein
MRARILPLLLLGLGTVHGADTLKILNPETYSGTCDASGAVALSTNLFAVGADEDNVLRIYRAGHAAAPVARFDMSSFLFPAGGREESDLEGAARVGDRIYWIGSHGLATEKETPHTRECLFATDIVWSNSQPLLKPAGQPYRGLLRDLFAEKKLAAFHLEVAARIPAKQPGGLNIEGLSATPEGHLLIGFRSPLSEGKALIIPLLNPEDVVLRGAAARFGDAQLLDLGGLGTRDIAEAAGDYRIIAGPGDGSSHFRLYRWSGLGTPVERITIPGLNDYHPEALIAYPGLGWHVFQILSDDGALRIGGLPCKKLSPGEQRFRSFWAGE